MVSIPTFRRLPSLATVSSVPVRYYFFLCVWALGRLAWFPCSASTSLVYLPLSFLQFVTPFPSLGALLPRSNLRYTTQRGLPLGRVSYWLASWHSSFTGLRMPSVLFSMSPSSFFSSAPFPVDGPLGFPFLMGLLSFWWPFSSLLLGLVLGFLGG